MRWKNILKHWLVSNLISIIVLVAGFMSLDYLAHGDAFHTYNQLGDLWGLFVGLTIVLFVFNFTTSYSREVERVTDERIARVEKTISQPKD